MRDTSLYVKDIITAIESIEAFIGVKHVVDQTVADSDFTIIARRGSPDAVLMSLDTFNSLMETVHLLKTPANAMHLAESIEQFRSGRLATDNNDGNNGVTKRR